MQHELPGGRSGVTEARPRDGAAVRRPAEPATSKPEVVAAQGERRGARSVAAAAGRRVTLARVLFGLFWLIDAALKWRPGFVSSYAAQVSGAAAGQPGWLSPWFRFWGREVARAPHAFAYVTAGVETAIAVGLVLGLARRLTYAGGLLWSLGIWSIPEGFGGPYAASSTDIGTGIIYALVFLMLYTMESVTGHRSWSLDRRLERLLPPWRLVARPAPAAPVQPDADGGRR